MTADWIKWIVASINTHCGTLITDYPVYFEGTTREPTNSENQFEIRINGPTFKNATRTFYHVDVQIDILIRSVSLPRDRYLEKLLQGIASDTLNGPIAIYQYPDYPNIHVECLNRVGPIKVNNFGKSDPPSDVTFSTVVANYKTILT